MIRISKYKPSAVDSEDNSMRDIEKEKIKDKLLFDMLFRDYR